MVILAQILIYFGLLCCAGSTVLFGYRDKYKNVGRWQIALIIVAIFAMMIGILIIPPIQQQ